MNNFEPRVPPDEEPVDRLLREFFLQEMPPALRSPDASSERPAHGAGPAGASRTRVEVVPAGPAARRGSWLTVAAGIALAGAALLLAVRGLSGPSGPDVRDAFQQAAVPPPSDARSPMSPTESVEAAGRVPEAVAMAAEASEEDEWLLTTVLPMRKRLDTLEGPVEMRVGFRIERVRLGDPDSGDEIEMDFPELEIEIFPIDD